MPIQDEITRAVLSRDEITRYLQGETGPDARERIEAYLGELRTTQRYSFYRALKHPVYLMLRKVERIGEHVDLARTATRGSRVVYASNHRSHLDWLVEPLVLDDNGVRPPIVAAGINLFGGPLGLLNRHVTGALPIRRNSRDPVYLMTLKAYVAELLRKHDLFFFPEGGRSYSGEMKPPKTGLLNAALQADHPEIVIVPTAVSYDLVLEDYVLGRQKIKRAQRPFSREVAEMVRYSVGYRSRAFVTFGKAISVEGIDATSRRAVLDLGHAVMKTIGRLYKILPTAVVAAAMRPSITKGDLRERADALIDTLRTCGANLGVASGAEAVESALEPLEARGIVVMEGGRVRVRDRNVLRYYARSLEHLLESPSRRPHFPFMYSGSKALFFALSRSTVLKRLASRYGMARQESFARRFIAGENVEEAIEAARVLQSRGLLLTLDYLGESVRTAEAAAAATREYVRLIDVLVASGIERNISLKLTQLGVDVDRATCVDNLRRIMDPAHRHGFFVRIDMENSPYTEVTLEVFETLWQQQYRNVGVALQSCLYRTEKDVRRMNELGARVRLVKGAYKEPPAVAHQKKADVDEAFRRLMRLLLDEGTYPAIATHDEKMIHDTRAYAAERGIESTRFEFQMLYGIRRDLQSSLVATGYLMRVYVPFGRQWFPYFMRRLGERPANVAFVIRGILSERVD